jgi:transcriptional regulator with GAF, ATPase, and Fis domain
MMTSPSAQFQPEDEAQRLYSLRTHDVLASLHEPIFDEFVAIAARIFSLPISLISLVEEEEVYYPASVGMPGHAKQPREEAVCSVAIQHNQAVVVYQDLELVEEGEVPAPALEAARSNQVRFYAGAALRLPDQRTVGTLCVIDRNPRTFSEHEQRLLEQIATLVSQTVVVRHTCMLLSEGGEAQWHHIREQLREELQALQALVRYLVKRYGTQIPVPADVLSQVERRLHDLDGILSEAC